MLMPATTVYLSGEFKCPAIGGFALTVQAEDFPVKVRALTNLIIIYDETSLVKIPFELLFAIEIGFAD